MRQPWLLVPKFKLLRLYREHGKYGRIDEDLLADVWSILSECVLKVLSNSDVKHDVTSSEFFGVRSYHDITPEVRKRWFHFVSDCADRHAPRDAMEVGTGGAARYSDQSRRLGELLSQAYSAERQGPAQLLLAMDRILNFSHGMGRMARWFVEGGTATLDEIARFEPAGITAGGLR